MTHRKNNRTKPVQNSNQVKRLNKIDDTYGIFKQEMEMDTDVNEDPIRERLLDESIDSFIESKERQEF
ncbi:hypothetical protein [Fictibacillus barbaricus]|uniref:Fur-regulated basic protein B n=1 Tax=Fictibacillus barbaricus TaxID=182136 RepID=A0ABS2ZG76_9BACL|nr:hypothetical protein [Fictibacillus barbaricus]MBN3545750.1 hypothetical protein [Fictibacillus barbaricus]GGB55807.1 hypothetical protein GCM10007199_22110 [Fictibacillus barbaricus]